MRRCTLLSASSVNTGNPRVSSSNRSESILRASANPLPAKHEPVLLLACMRVVSKWPTHSLGSATGPTTSRIALILGTTHGQREPAPPPPPPRPTPSPLLPQMPHRQLALATATACCHSEAGTGRLLRSRICLHSWGLEVPERNALDAAEARARSRCVTKERTTESSSELSRKGPFFIVVREEVSVGGGFRDFRMDETNASILE
mmetsp:Transcript_33144/g.74860  ORF Transcript_33144/g.74860 Transcript_33144/m.74860 type:complete len:204 (+) Transcript_33144:741-1352(+)